MHPLECDLLVVDEASMVDVLLMRFLLQALPDTAALLYTGVTRGKRLVVLGWPATGARHRGQEPGRTQALVQTAGLARGPRGSMGRERVPLHDAVGFRGRWRQDRFGVDRARPPHAAGWKWAAGIVQRILMPSDSVRSCGLRLVLIGQPPIGPIKAQTVSCAKRPNFQTRP